MGAQNNRGGVISKRAKFKIYKLLKLQRKWLLYLRKLQRIQAKS